MSTVADILHFIAPLDGWLSPHEGFFLYTSAKKVANNAIVEIGSWKGKSTICLAAGSKEGRKHMVYAIDPHKGEFSRGRGVGRKAPTFQEFRTNLQMAGVLGLVTPLIATSEDAAKKWKKKISLLFIDGLHDYEHAYRDYVLWSPFVVTNGVIAFHDAFCGHDGPERVILQEILRQKTWKDIGVVGSIIYVQKGKPKTLMQQVNLIRLRLLIPLALSLNKINLPHFIRFILIHRIIKIFLLNKYTLQLSLTHKA